MDRRAVGVLLRTDCPFTYHVQTFPVLTWQERRRLFGYKNMFDVAPHHVLFIDGTLNHLLRNCSELVGSKIENLGVLQG